MDDIRARQRIITLLIILVLYFIFDASPPPQLSFKEIDKAVTSESLAWQVLNGTRYGDFDPAAGRWLNLTGFRGDQAWSWGSLPEVQARAREFVTHAVGAQRSASLVDGHIPVSPSLQFYRNVTGEVKGSWKRSRLSSVNEVSKETNASTSLDSPFQHAFQHNITGNAGNLRIDFKEKGQPDVFNGLHARGLRARISIYDDTVGDSTTIILTGIHFLETGSIVLTTHSAKFPALFGLPHLTLSESHFLASQHRLNRTLKDVINLQSSHQLKSAAPWSSSLGNNEKHSCEILVYFQLYPLRSATDAETTELELRFPQGRLPMNAEELHMNLIMFSPNCGYVIESTHESKKPSLVSEAENHLSGMKVESYNDRVKKHSLVLALIIVLQTLSIVRQRKDTSTPSMKNRISVKTMLILNIADGLVALSFIPMVAFTDSVFPVMATVALVGMLCVYFNAPLLVSIWMVQHEEALRESRQQTASTSNSGQSSAPSQRIPIITAAGVELLPLPVTSGPAVAIIGADGEILGIGDDETRDPRSVISSRLAFGAVSLWLCSIWMTSAPPVVQQIYFFALSLAYVSCWIPQIIRNAMRNCRKALAWDFVVCQSVLRLIPLIYFYTYEQNLADSTTSHTKAAILVLLSWTQICLLVIQYVVGPRLFVPKAWLPPAYDYHPILKEDDESTQIILGYSTSPTSPTFKHTQSPQTSTETKGSRSKRRFDCAICMQDVEVPIIPNHSSDPHRHEAARSNKTDNMLQNSFLWRRAYMITPCRHVFHTKCLETAMRYRLQCPICREGLPPL